MWTSSHTPLRFSRAATLYLGALMVPALLAAQQVATQQVAAQPAQSTRSGAIRWADSLDVTIHHATLRTDAAALQRAAALADRALQAFPNDALLLHYRGFVAFRLGQQAAMSAATRERAKPYFEETLEWMDRSIAVRPLAESHAVRASAMGQLMAGGMLAGMRYGAAASKAETLARELGAENPRVLFLQALNTWFKPAMFGGGEDKARALMTRALAAFATDHPASGMPAWGHAEALAWHGQMEQKAGRGDAARAAFAHALTIEPEYGWVKYTLLPSVK